MYTADFAEVFDPAGQIHSADHGTGDVTTDWISMKNYHRMVAAIDVGAMSTNATLDAKLEEAQDSSGTGAQDISGKSITQLDESAGDGDDFLVIDLQGEELDVNDGYEYVRLTLTVGTDSVQASAILYGMISRFKPVGLTNYTEAVS